MKIFKLSNPKYLRKSFISSTLANTIFFFFKFFFSRKLRSFVKSKIIEENQKLERTQRIAKKFFHFFNWRILFFFFSEISERNNDYSDTLDFKRGQVSGGCGVGHVFRFGSPFAVLIYFYIYIYIDKNARYRSQFWTDLHEIHMVDAGLLMGEPCCFWKQSAQ